MDVWVETVGARRSLLATFESLSSDQWDVPSLCEGWTVRDVLAHLVLAAKPPRRRFATAVLRTRSFDAANRDLAIADAPSEQFLGQQIRSMHQGKTWQQTVAETQPGFTTPDLRSARQ